MQKACVVFGVFFIYLIVVCPSKSFSADNGQVRKFDPVPIIWYERNARKTAWLALDEVAVFDQDPQVGARSLHINGRIIKQNRFITLYELAAPVDRKWFQTESPPASAVLQAQKMSPVFYTSPTSKNNPADRLALTGEIVVQFKESLTQKEIQAAENTFGLVPVKTFAELAGTFIYRTASVFQSLETANAMNASGIVNYSFPNFYRSRSTRELPDDLLFTDQWHLENTGQAGGQIGADVNILPVWTYFKGSGDTVIALLDDGLTISHDDLIDNIMLDACWDYVDQDGNPSHDMFLEGHDTRVAGVAAARGFNLIGVTGAAPHAGLVGFRLMGASTDVNVADALIRKNDIIDIYNNSWGPPDWSPTYGRVYLEGPSPLVEDAVEFGIRNGRAGLGNIYVWAGGNGYDQDNSNYDGYANSRFTIAVSASNNMGKRSVYSEKGANLLVNAPSGDIAPGGGTLGITTTDRNIGYTANFNGTSASAPLVSGIIALMLDANPQLTWRDVQHILIETARQNDPEDGDWVLNGAGYWVNHKYGFGRIDAQAAVDTALNWESVGEETAVEAASAPELIIPDNDATGVVDTIFINEDLQVEYVDVYFTAADHPHWGNLEVVLTSPEGTPSVLAEVHDRIALGSIYDNWRFGSVRHFGETSMGTWTLTVKDLTAGDSGTFQNWKLKIYGNADSVYPAAATGSAVSVTANSATLTGWIHPTDPISSYYFEYGPSPMYGSKTADISIHGGSEAVAATAYLSGLEPNAIYHFRLIAETGNQTLYGNDQTFETATVSDLVGFVTRLYEQSLGRSPDQAGLNYWVNSLLDGSRTGADVTRGFIFSQEFRAQNLPDPEFVTLLYRVLFDRQPDEPGYVHWLNLLHNGVDRTHIFEGFVQAQEFRSMCRSYTIASDSTEVFVSRFYHLCLNRAPDPEGLENWVTALLDGGRTGADIAWGFIFSAEFAGQRISFDRYLTLLYQVLLNRDPDQTGFSSWLELHNQGLSAADVLAGFVYSVEFAALCNTYGISAF